MKRTVSIILLISCLLLSGCNRHLPYEEQVARNFVKEAFSDVSGRFEDEIMMDKDCKGFLIQGHVSSGDFKLTLKDDDTGEIKEIYVNGNVEEQIDITRKEARHEWSLINEYE